MRYLATRHKGKVNTSSSGFSSEASRRGKYPACYFPQDEYSPCFPASGLILCLFLYVQQDHRNIKGKNTLK